MHASILFTVASLFLLGSHSLPQPANLETTSSINARHHGSHMSADAMQWCENHPNVCSHFSSGSNSTTTTEKRQAPTEHYQLPDGMTWEDFKKHWKQGKQGSDGYGSGTNSTTTRKMGKWKS